MKIITMLSVILAGLLTLSACNTMEGVGEDVEAAGSKLDKTAEQNRNY